jgi:hypothetical protein
MEVHAHTHTARKKWTHYFWEFLMLFLAVFCGFLAEYQLEHKIEKNKAKQYIVSFYQDLKNDTAEFAGHIATDKEKVEALSGVFNCYRMLEKNPKEDSCLRKLIRYSSSFTDLIYTDRTLQQLKNAGGMRLLQKEDADSILAYDYRLRRYLSYESSLLQERQTNIRDLYNGILNFKSKRELGLPADSLTDADKEYLLFTTDKAVLNKLFNEIYHYSESIKNARLRMISGLQARAKRLIIYFKNKYHFE